MRVYAQKITDDAKAKLVEAIEPSDARNLLISMADWFVSRLQ